MSNKKLLGIMIASTLGIIIFSNISHADTATGDISSGTTTTGTTSTGIVSTGIATSGTANTGILVTWIQSSHSGLCQIINNTILKKITMICGSGGGTTGIINSGTATTGTVMTGTTTSGSTVTGTEFSQALSWMYTNGLTKYDNETDYRSNDYMTREEAAKIIGQAYIVLGYAQTEKNTDCTFTDMNEVDPSLSGFVINSCKRGLFKGSNGKFMPTKTITRPEAIAVLIRMFEGKLSNESRIPRWGDYYLKARALGLTTINNQSAFDKEISRQEIAIYIYRLKNMVTNDTLKIMGLNKISQIEGTGTQQILTGILAYFSSLANSMSVSDDPELEEAIRWMNDNGLTNYKTIAEYKPFEVLNREQTAKILYNFGEVFKFMQTTHSAATTECTFQDINDADSSLVTFIISSCQENILKGFNGYFNPKATINKAQFISAIIRMFEGKNLDETTNPRWKNYFEKAQELGIVSPADLITFENPITRYEAALFLYRFKVKYQMLQNVNTNKTQNEVINTVPGSISTGINSLPEGNIYIDMNLLENGNFDIGYIEVFSNTYKIVKSTTEKYFEENFVRYGDVYAIDNDEKIGTINFVVSNGYVVDGMIRLPTQTFQVSQLQNTKAYYKMQQIK